MTTMLERAAMAAAAADATLHNGPDLYKINPDLYLRLTRAVLMAVRDAGVSEAMNEARDDEIERVNPHASPEAYSVSDNEWRVMIDAIMNEETK